MGRVDVIDSRNLNIKNGWRRDIFFSPFVFTLGTTISVVKDYLAPKKRTGPSCPHLPLKHCAIILFKVYNIVRRR